MWEFQSDPIIQRYLLPDRAVYNQRQCCHTTNHPQMCFLWNFAHKGGNRSVGKKKKKSILVSPDSCLFNFRPNQCSSQQHPAIPWVLCCPQPTSTCCPPACSTTGNSKPSCLPAGTTTLAPSLATAALVPILAHQPLAKPFSVVSAPAALSFGHGQSQKPDLDQLSPAAGVHAGTAPALLRCSFSKDSALLGTLSNFCLFWRFFFPVKVCSLDLRKNL